MIFFDFDLDLRCEFIENIAMKLDFVLSIDECDDDESRLEFERLGLINSGERIWIRW